MDTQSLILAAVLVVGFAALAVTLRRPQTPAASSQTTEALVGRALAEQRESIALAIAEALRTLQEANETRLQSADKSVAEHIKVVSTALAELQRQTGDWELKRAEQITELKTATGATHEAVEKLNAETASLSGAMKGNQTRGKWGEISLRRIVESCGMHEHVDFLEQKQEAGEGEGKPDVTVRLPHGRVVYIDAKVPWANYQRMVTAEDAAARADLLAKHERDVRGHIDALAGRTYTGSAESLDYVIMYVPVEPALAAALVANPDLLDYATKRKVVLTSPMSLIVTLNNFNHSWDADSKVRNATSIVDATEELMKRVGDMVASMGKVGDNLRKAGEMYNKSVGTFNSRVVPQAGKIDKLRQKDMTMAELAEVDFEPREFKTAAWGSASDPADLISLPVDLPDDE